MIETLQSICVNTAYACAAWVEGCFRVQIAAAGGPIGKFWRVPLASFVS